MCVSGEMYLYRKRLFNALRFFALRLLCSVLCEGSSRYSGETAASQSQALTRFGMSFGEMHSELICTMWIAKAIDDDSMMMIMREAGKSSQLEWIMQHLNHRQGRKRKKDPDIVKRLLCNLSSPLRLRIEQITRDELLQLFFFLFITSSTNSIKSFHLTLDSLWGANSSRNQIRAPRYARERKSRTEKNFQNLNKILIGILLEEATWIGNKGSRSLLIIREIN